MLDSGLDEEEEEGMEACVVCRDGEEKGEDGVGIVGRDIVFSVLVEERG